jgi:hypothetical protein
MEPVMLIIDALAAGAAAAGKDVGKQAVKDAYDGLKSVIKKWFAEKKRPEGETALAKYEEKPWAREEALKDSLIETGADKAPEILKAVAVFKQALGKTPEGQKVITKYNLNITDSQVGVISDHAKIEGGIHFGATKK